uniref:Putative FH2-domain-containing protein n=1 Tax=Moniliophthora roreri TaxID=221103 RepID=A0A0W0GB16_MONRR
MASPPLPPGPPPPPMASKGPATPRFTKPGKRLKPFFWNKVANPAIASTVWNEDTSEIQFDLNDLEATFAIDNSPSSISQTSLSSLSKKQNLTTLLDITRANNIAIMLSRIKNLGLSEIRLALLELNDEKLTVDDLKAISKQLPTSEEVIRIRDFGDVSKLAKADQYLSQIITIPRLTERLDAMIFRRKLEFDVEEVRPELNILKSVCSELEISQRFKGVLKAILAIGNALNGTSFRGGARGFQLEALLKLKETKTVKGGTECPTLLHYVAKVLMRSSPELLTFSEELPHLEAASRISVQNTMQSVNQLVSGLKQVQTEITEANKRKSSPLNDRFISTMEIFVKEASTVVKSLRNMASEVEDKLRKLLIYYGENPDSPDALKPEEFFGLILSFSASLQKSSLEVLDAQAKLEAPKAMPAEEETSEDKTLESTMKGDKLPPSQGSRLLSPTGSQGRALGRDLDQAMNSVRRTARRQQRAAARPLSRIFIDGAPPSGGSRFMPPTDAAPPSSGSRILPPSEA